MKIINRLRDERGQGLMEYTLIVFLVALVFWGGMKSTNIGDELAGLEQSRRLHQRPVLLWFLITLADPESPSWT